MPRIGDVNVTPLEYADSIRKQVEKVSHSRLYTYRYVWKRDDYESLCVRYLTGTALEHVKFCTDLAADDHVLSATKEYVSEVDCNYLLLVSAVKVEKKEKIVHEEN